MFSWAWWWSCRSAITIFSPPGLMEMEDKISFDGTSAIAEDLKLNTSTETLEEEVFSVVDGGGADNSGSLHGIQAGARRLVWTGQAPAIGVSEWKELFEKNPKSLPEWPPSCNKKANQRSLCPACSTKEGPQNQVSL